jgi:hypothetical protein
MRIQEALRYGGFDPADTAAADLAAKNMETLERKAPLKSLWKILPLQKTETGFLAGAGLKLEGKTANLMLESSSHVIVGAVTLGAGVDLEISRRQLMNMKDALLFDGCANAYLEDELDKFQEKLQERLQPKFLTDRFSCGYGDLPLSLQVQIDEILDMKKIGIALSDSLMMHPCKSVTFFIGISEIKQVAKIRGCAYCSLAGSCALRKKGKFCG